MWNNFVFLRLHVWMIHKSNTFKAWRIPECKLEQLLVVKAPQVGWTSRVDESGEQAGWTSRVDKSCGQVRDGGV